MDVYRIVANGPTATGVKVYGPNGEEIKGVMRVDIAPMIAGQLLKAQITVLVALDIAVEAEVGA
jgi:hypothetical protein